jgi:hypothetical protein
LPHRNKYARAVHKKQEGLSVFFGKLDRTLGPCFYFIFCGDGTILEEKWSRIPQTADAQPAGHPDSDKAGVAVERR